jgi:hypothetical protein
MKYEMARKAKKPTKGVSIMFQGFSRVIFILFTRLKYWFV